jgi:hypothetical protein
MRNKNIYTVFFIVIYLLLGHPHAYAQMDSARKQMGSVQKRFRVAVFTPLYLDSAFDATGGYKYGKQFPRFINPGLEFYEGIQLAIDSMQAEKLPLDVYVYDTRSVTTTLEQQANAPETDSAGLYIGYVTPAEERVIAAAAHRKNIPFINANLPNDAGINNNSSLVILNSTLKTHCEGIYHFLQRYYPNTPITVLRKKGAMEDRLKTYFIDYEKDTYGVKLRMKYINTDGPGAGNVLQYLDSSRLNIILAGSLDETFGKNIAQQLAAAGKTYKSLLVGMPTWDAITDFGKKEYRGQDMIYSTPFYSDRTDYVSDSITNYFNNTMFSRPSDMVFRGYECMYRFGKLLVEKDSNLVSSIGEKKYRVFTDFDIQPVLNRQTMSIDYFENKKLYFIKKTDGVVKQVY